MHEIAAACLARMPWPPTDTPSGLRARERRLVQCGVTPQAIAMSCGIPEMIAHVAGHM